MSEYEGIKLPDDLFEVLKKGKTVAVLATFSEKGVPHTTPIQCIYPKGRESLLLSINKNHTGYHNLVWQKKVMLCFMAEGNVAYSVLGRAGIVKAPSSIHPLMNIARVDIVDVKNDCDVLVRVEGGVTWSYIDEETEQLLTGLIEELKDLALTL